MLMDRFKKTGELSSLFLHVSNDMSGPEQNVRQVAGVTATQDEIDDMSDVSEDPRYYCDATCQRCDAPCVRHMFGHCFHQLCCHHYQW